MRLRTLSILVVLPLMIGAAVASLHPQALPLAPKPAPPHADGALLPPPGFDLTAMDRAADPCGNFYQFACGGWMARNPARPDEPRWSRLQELQERNLGTLRRLAEQAVASPDTPGGDRSKVGIYYAACMDESGIEAKGLAPLEAQLARIRSLSGRAGLPEVFAGLARLGIRAPFRLSVEQDFKDATSVIVVLDQGGLGLPDRDYYVREGQSAAHLRQQYVRHVERMLSLLGHPPASARREAETVMAMETALARGSLARTERRDPGKIYHKMTVDQLAALASSVGWARYLGYLGIPGVKSFNVAVPGFFSALDGQVKQRTVGEWKTYLTWHVLRASAGSLPAAFQNENFSFYGKTLTGATELRPRWRRCIEMADRHLGDALGRLFVDETFGIDGRTRAMALVRALKAALGRDIRDLPWMGEQTRREAQTKLAAIAEQIGYPDRWRDYSRLEIVRGDALGNSLRSSAFDVERQLAKIGRPVDRSDWLISAPTVDAYYDPQLNQITFPAGILQPPFFDRHMDDAVNFGAIGSVIGHELTHAFDDEGRRFDRQGNLRNWWTQEDAKAFEERAACFITQYGAYPAVGDVTLNGSLTLGENTADNGGVRIALMALLDTLAGQQVAPLDGFTPEQRLFLGYAQVWCQNQTDEMARLLATTDPHSPGKYRVNGVVANMPEFQKAFSCKGGVPPLRGKICRVW